MHDHRRTRLFAILAALTLLLLLGACSDDTSGSDSTSCPEGQRFNEIQGCVSAHDMGPDAGGDTRSPQTPEDESDATSTPDADQPPEDDAGQQPPEEDAGQDAGHQPPEQDAGQDAGQQPSDTDEPPAECGPGKIIGRACAPSGAALGGATVTVTGYDCDGEPFEMTTTTNREGEYEFDDVPSGAHELHVSTGSFSGDDRVFVAPGATTDLTDASGKVCLDAANVKLAVIEGVYDSVELLLTDLGLEFDIKGGDEMGFLYGGPLDDATAFLGNLSAMQEYDVIFINCGELWNNMSLFGGATAAVNNLRAYVDGGGSLYASDWAHHFVEKMYPDMIDFYGNNAQTNNALMGYAPQTISANVLSSGLQGALGHDETTIDFPHEPAQNVLNNNWAVAEGAGPETTVHIHGDVKLCASESSCTSPGGSVHNAPLLLSYGTPAGGTVFFTSFHNDSQMGISQDMEEILRFLIFQL